ncbi:hypothetical protein PsYK624_166480 [Phanerochaete sordida]|uniref:BTB domain-containing protein n=1 Tax=Phanerochaete sordida TaxID=48140 RepID=A0A9P3LMA4_9APHY|nr:hypothetical protein PsYK624_166480 [Phanerochaete sordida]
MPTPQHVLAKVPAGDSLADALADSLAGVPFNDVVFYAPATQLPSGNFEGQLRAVHANSRILTASSAYFRELLAEPAPPVRPQRPVQPGVSVSADEEAGHGSDGSSLDGSDFDALESVLGTQSDAPLPEDKDDGPSLNFAHSGNVAPAAPVLEAVIFYIYTGKVHFLPSQDANGCDKAKRPACSCKEVYRFADEAGLDELKELADAHLFAQLSAHNILEEVFSPFSGRYPEILRRQVTLLLERYLTPTTHAALGSIVERVVRGETPHAAPALAMLLGELTPATRPVAPAPARLSEPSLSKITRSQRVPDSPPPSPPSPAGLSPHASPPASPTGLSPPATPPPAAPRPSSPEPAPERYGLWWSPLSVQPSGWGISYRPPLPSKNTFPAPVTTRPLTASPIPEQSPPMSPGQRTASVSSYGGDDRPALYSPQAPPLEAPAGENVPHGLMLSGVSCGPSAGDGPSDAELEGSEARRRLLNQEKKKRQAQIPHCACCSYSR